MTQLNLTPLLLAGFAIVGIGATAHATPLPLAESSLTAACIIGTGSAVLDREDVVSESQIPSAASGSCDVTATDTETGDRVPNYSVSIQQVGEAQTAFGRTPFVRAQASFTMTNTDDAGPFANDSAVSAGANVNYRVGMRFSPNLPGRDRVPVRMPWAMETSTDGIGSASAGITVSGANGIFSETIGGNDGASGNETFWVRRPFNGFEVVFIVAMNAECRVTPNARTRNVFGECLAVADPNFYLDQELFDATRAAAGLDTFDLYENIEFFVPDNMDLSSVGPLFDPNGGSTIVPAPATASLLGFAALLLLRRPWRRHPS